MIWTVISQVVEFQKKPSLLSSRLTDTEVGSIKLKICGSLRSAIFWKPEIEDISSKKCYVKGVAFLL